MRVRAQGNAGTDERLSVSCELGRLLGVWRGSGTVRRGDVFEVELDFSGSPAWTEATAADDDAAHDGFVVGTITSVFDDGVTSVQVGSAAILLEMAGPPLRDAVGRRIRLNTEDLEFWPSGV